MSTPKYTMEAKKLKYHNLHKQQVFGINGVCISYWVTLGSWQRVLHYRLDPLQFTFSEHFPYIKKSKLIKED